MGRAREGVVHSERAIELDPFNALYHGLHGVVLVYHRRWDDALAAARAATSIRADAPVATSVVQFVYLSKGMRDEQLADQRLRIARDRSAWRRSNGASRKADTRALSGLSPTCSRHGTRRAEYLRCARHREAVSRRRRQGPGPGLADKGYEHRDQ